MTIDQGDGSAAVATKVMAYMNLVTRGIDADKGARWFHYGEHGVDLYDSGARVSQQRIKDRPQAVAGLVRAVHKGVRDTLAEPDARFARAFIRRKEAFDMQCVPIAVEVFDRRFLPPLAERKFASK